MKELQVTGQHDLETAIETAIKRYREEEVRLVKENLTKIVSISEIQRLSILRHVSLLRRGKHSRCFTYALTHM